MRASIIISRRGGEYIATVSGKFGGGYSGAHAGRTPEDAATFAAREMIRYAQSNSEGGDLIAPEDVLARVPQHLRSVAAH